MNTLYWVFLLGISWLSIFIYVFYNIFYIIPKLKRNARLEGYCTIQNEKMKLLEKYNELKAENENLKNGLYLFKDKFCEYTDICRNDKLVKEIEWLF